MKKILSVLVMACIWVGVLAQVDSTVVIGVEVVAPRKEKASRTNFYLSGGMQYKTWYSVPMVPENIDATVLRNGNELVTPGWFISAGASKPTDLHLEFGIWLSYFQSSVPVAFAGQRSTGDWVLEQTGSLYTDPYAYNVDRINNVYAIRIFSRYNFNFSPFNYWIAVYAGTYSSNIIYQGEGQSDPEGSYNHTSLGVNGQTGLDYVISDELGRARFSFTLFAEFLSPRVSESIFGLFENNWYYISDADNYVVSPIRFGVMIGIH
ncbi:MAG: hypothetical protein ACOYXB_02350 [Bacteroidota bacterium]